MRPSFIAAHTGRAVLCRGVCVFVRSPRSLQLLSKHAGLLARHLKVIDVFLVPPLIQLTCFFPPPTLAVRTWSRYHPPCMLQPITSVSPSVTAAPSASLLLFSIMSRIHQWLSLIFACLIISSLQFVLSDCHYVLENRWLGFQHQALAFINVVVGGFVVLSDNTLFTLNHPNRTKTAQALSCIQQVYLKFSPSAASVYFFYVIVWCWCLVRTLF